MWSSSAFCSHPDYHSNIPEPDCEEATLIQVYFKNQVLDKVCDPASFITVLISGEYLDERFPVCGVFDRSLVEGLASPGGWPANYWLAPVGGGQFILSMKEDLYDAVELVNTHAGEINKKVSGNRATKQFRISLR